MKKRIEVVLEDNEMEFIKQLQKEGVYGEDLSLNEVMARIFHLQLREDMEYYENSGF